MNELGIYDYSGYYAQFGADPTLVNAYYGLVAPGIATAWSTGGSVYGKRGRRQTLRGGSLRARLNGPARVDAWRLGCRKVMADQAAGAAV
jgi:hypothetical protein